MSNRASYRFGADVFPAKLRAEAPNRTLKTPTTLWRYTQGLTTRWETTRSGPGVIQHRRNLLNGASRSTSGWRHTGTPRKIHERIDARESRRDGDSRDSHDGASDEGEGEPHAVSLLVPRSRCVWRRRRRRTPQRQSKIPWALEKQKVECNLWAWAVVPVPGRT
jgi:hypothetical protein